MRDDLVDRAFAQIARTESRVEIGVLGAYGEAVRAHDAFARGRLDRASDALRRAIELPELFVSDTVFAGVAPFVADALDDDFFVHPRLDALFAETRLHARHRDDVTVLAGSACHHLRRTQRREALADLRLGLRCLTRPLASSRPLLVLAAQHFEESELPSLAGFTDIEVHGDEPAGATNARAPTLAMRNAISSRDARSTAASDWTDYALDQQTVTGSGGTAKVSNAFSQTGRTVKVSTIRRTM